MTTMIKTCIPVFSSLYGSLLAAFRLPAACDEADGEGTGPQDKAGEAFLTFNPYCHW